MNAYVTFDTLKYSAPHGRFSPARSKPSTARITLSGASDVSYGPGTTREWVGVLTAPAKADTGWGSIDDLRDTLDKRQALAFIDHYGTAVTVYAIGVHNEMSFTPMWDGDSNTWTVSVRLVLDYGGGALVPLDTLSAETSIIDADAIGGAVGVDMDTVELEGAAGYAFPSRPVILEELYVIVSAEENSVPQVITMGTLSASGSAESSAVS
jgi:hypothetical protein